MGCRDLPISCRGKIAERYDLKPNKQKHWQFEGKCPKCGHGGFSITAPDQNPNAPRHIWWCNCHRCQCPPAAVRAVMLADGITADCLGTYRQRDLETATRAAEPDADADPATVLRSAMLEVLADGKIRALADLKLRMLEIIEGKPAPGGWDGFVAFAGRAGVSRSKRYDAADRWGRSATEVGTTAAETVSSDCRSEAISAVPKRDNGHMRRGDDKGRSEIPAARFVAERRESRNGTTGKTDTRRSETSARNVGSPETGQPTPGHK